MNALDRLNALAAAPKPWLVSVAYEDGRVRTLRQPLEGSARNYAAAESRKIGKALISRETGATVMVKSVTVEYLPE